MKPWIVVTGSAGFIGQNIIAELSKSHEIAALDLIPVNDPNLNQNLNQFELDLGNGESIAHFFRIHPRPIAGLINLAAFYSFSNKPSVHYQRLLRGLPSLAEQFVRLRTEDACFIQASSMACLEPLPLGMLLNNQSPSVARWEYPKFKRDSEEILRSALKFEHYVELVLAAVYSDFCELVPLYKFLSAHRNLSLQRWFFPGNADRGLTYIHVDDVAAAFKAQLESQSTKRRLLIGEYEPTTYKTIAQIMDVELYGFVIPKLKVPKWVAKFGAFVLSKIFKRSFYQPWMIDLVDEHYCFDLQAAKEQLNWQPTRSLTRTLPLMVEKLKKNSRLWDSINERRPWSDDDWPQLKHLEKEPYASQGIKHGR
jgi:nucleoside-diphosphate-sugar epimerase